MPKTAPDLTPKPYRLLKTDLAAKLSARSTGGITYLLLASEEDVPALYLAVTANEGGGLWSKEAISLDTIEEVLAPYAGGPFPSRTLRGAVVGRSSNNPPFICGVLKNLGLVVKSPDKAHQYVKTGDWQAFREEWLSAPGEAVIYPPVTDGATEAPEATVANAASKEVPAKSGKAKRKKIEVADPEAGASNEDHPPEVEEVSDAETAHAG